MELFYIGDSFYGASSSSMSSIYERGTFRRMDWGFVQVALREGKEIHIFPATNDEMLWAYQKLEVDG